MEKKKISLKYIAEHLNISAAVVSVVLNNRQGNIRVSKEVRKKVIELANELNYRPNSLARSLKTGKTYTIGLLVSDISNHYYSKLARSVEDAANKAGYNVIFCSSDENAEKEASLIHIFRERKVDGILLSGTQQNEDIIKLLENEKYPLVLIDRDYKNSKAPFVGLYDQNSTGAYILTNHLINNGFKNIALLTAYPYLQPMKLREEGYEKALRENGIDINPELRCVISYKNIYSAIRYEIDKLCRLKIKPDAIFTLNNKLALYCLQVLHDLKQKIPQDIGFACFDDHELFSFYKPRITAVDHSASGVGAKAVKLLMNEIDKISNSGYREIIPATLKIRESSTKK